MNTKRILAAAAMLAAAVPAAAFADAEEDPVRNVVVRQRWPWSQKVDIDYYYAGENPTSLVFTATWTGQETPVSLSAVSDFASLQRSGGFYVSHGQHRFEWDPVAAGYGDATLSNFRVTITPGEDPRTYLVLNLTSGGYTFKAEPPAGGWTDTHKRNYMVFRRIPAGTYRLGTSADDLEAVLGTLSVANKGHALNQTPRTVTLTSDFYLALFPMTSRQYNAIRGTNNSNAITPTYTMTDYRYIRGVTIEDGETPVNWPATGYKVGDTTEPKSSLVKALRTKSASTGQPELLIDLPTESMWEVGMRAGTSTFYPNGGTTNNVVDELLAFLDEIGHPKCLTNNDPWTYDVGSKAPNRWGIYDFSIRGELCLDWANYQGYYSTSTTPNIQNPVAGTDPIGRTTASSKNYRISRGGSAEGTTYSLLSTHTAKRAVVELDPAAKATFNGCVRFAIHLKPLVDIK